MVVGHGAGELLRAACEALLSPDASGGARAGVGARGAGRLAGLGAAPAAGPRGRRATRARPARPGRRPGRRRLLAACGERTSFVALCSPNDPTGGEVDAAALRRLAERLPEGTWIVLDAALAEFGEADLAR